MNSPSGNGEWGPIAIPSGSPRAPEQHRAARAAVAVGDLGARSLRDQGQTLQIPSPDQDVVRYFEADQQAEAVK